MLWKKFNDQMAVILMGTILLLWMADPFFAAIYKIQIDRAIIGATIVAFTLIVQFYFRKDKPPTPGDTEGKPPEPTK